MAGFELKNMQKIPGKHIKTLKPHKFIYKMLTGTAATFYTVSGMTVHPQIRTLYLADSGNHRIRICTPGGVVTTLSGNGVAGNVDGVLL